MKIKRYLMLVAACTLFLGKSFAANNEKPFVIPELQEWRGAQGMFTPSATSRIVYASKEPAIATFHLFDIFEQILFVSS